MSSRIRQDLLQRAGEFNIQLEDVSITHLTFGKVCDSTASLLYGVWQIVRQEFTQVCRSEYAIIHYQPSYLGCRSETNCPAGYVFACYRDTCVLSRSQMLSGPSLLLKRWVEVTTDWRQKSNKRNRRNKSGRLPSSERRARQRRRRRSRKHLQRLERRLWHSGRLKRARQLFSRCRETQMWRMCRVAAAMFSSMSRQEDSAEGVR